MSHFSTNLRAFTKIPPGLGLPKYQIKLKILSACSIGTLIAKVTSDSAWSTSSHIQFLEICALGVSTMETLKSFQNNIPCLYTVTVQ